MKARLAPRCRSRAAALRACLAVVAAWGLAFSAPAQPAANAAPLLAEIDRWVAYGHDHPDEALARLDQLADKAAPGAQARAVVLARGLVAAASARSEVLNAALLALAGQAPDLLATADAALIRAAAADVRGDTGAALEAAKAALAAYEGACPSGGDCEHRGRWRALDLLARQERHRGMSSQAQQHALAAVEVARAAGDVPREALSLAAAAVLADQLGERGVARSRLDQAQALAYSDGDPALRSRLMQVDTLWQRRAGDLEAARRSARAGLALARQAGSPRLEAAHLANLSDALVALAQPQAALQAINEALPIARRHGDRRIERVLMHNAALAHIALGQGHAARQDVDRVLEVYRASGASAGQVTALREFADAYAAAGDMRSALALFHKERELAAEIMASNRDAALTELRKRFDHEAQQRRLEQLGRENTLVNTQLDNRVAMQKVWAAGALALLLAAAVVALMYRRVRLLNRKLAHNQAFLRAQSQRDPLTGLYNRRGLHEAAAARGHDLSFEGAVMLIDIDHFKRINDGHGHAAGDAVLVEVARRLAESVRGDDLVVRWGGEEFLICMPGGDIAGDSAGDLPARAQALAQHVLHAVGARTVELPDASGLQVTVSVGYGCFPLLPARLPMGLERVVNLADMALYTAKNQGRNAAVGIVRAEAAHNDELLALERGFDQARHEGRVTLKTLPGPLAPAVRNARVADEVAPSH